MANPSDLAQQDALTNALLAIFSVLLLLLVQTGLSDVVARLEAQALGALPDDLNEPTGGAAAIAIIPRADMAVIVAPPGVIVTRVSPAGKLDQQAGHTSQGAATLWQFQRESASLPQTVWIHNPGRVPQDVPILLDGAWINQRPARLAPDESIYLLLCPNGTGFAFRRSGGRCQ